MLDASITVSMDPFGAFVGDQLGPAQRPTGSSMQSFFIGVGSVVASSLPWLLTRAGVSNESTAASGLAAVPDSVRYSFDLGAAVLFLAIGWTVLRTREYPPETLHGFSDSLATPEPPVALTTDRGQRAQGLFWATLGLAGLATVAVTHLDKQL